MRVLAVLILAGLLYLGIKDLPRAVEYQIRSNTTGSPVGEEGEKHEQGY